MSAEERDGVPLTNLDQPLFGGAQATKRDLVDYLDAMSERILPGLRDRPLSVIRVLRGQRPFMQKNVPRYTPQWVRTVPMWAESSAREISYALCNDRRTLMWFANQRAIEYHPALVRVDAPHHQTHLILDIDPPAGADFGVAARAAHLVRQALADAGLTGVVKTSGSKGVHVLVPLARVEDIVGSAPPARVEDVVGSAPPARAEDVVGSAPPARAEDIAAATRALAVRAERLDPDLATTAFIRADREGKVFLDSTRVGGATVAATYSPRVRPGVPVSYPVAWSDLDRITPADFTIRTAPRLPDPWAGEMPRAQVLPADLVEEGHAIPIARVQAMHEGKRRARARRQQS